jgi:hypothetical protein
MASIDTLKTLINHKIGYTNNNGGTKYNVFVNENNKSPQNGIFLFYTNDNAFVSTSRASYYQNSIQVAVKNNDYDRARTSAYNCLEYIRAREKTTSGVYFIPSTTPTYLGIDDMGSYVWTFDVMIKGAK